MSLLRLKRDVAYGGAVVFHMVGYRPQRYFMILDELASALPHILKRTEDGSIQFPTGHMGGTISSFLHCLGHTADIEFSLTEDSPEDLLAFRDWYREFLPNADYATAFQSFGLLSDGVVNVWFGAYKNTRAVQSKAPAELTPEGAAKAETDPNFTQGGGAS